MVYFRKMDLVKIREEREGDGGVEVKVKGIYPKGDFINSMFESNPIKLKFLKVKLLTIYA